MRELRHLTVEDEKMLTELVIGGYPIRSALRDIDQLIQEKITKDREERGDVRSED